MPATFPRGRTSARSAPAARLIESSAAGWSHESRLFVDSRIGATAEAGDIVLAQAEGLLGPDPIAGELGELLAGRVTGRQTDAEITLFKSLGMAVEDVAAAHLAYSRARDRGCGRQVAL